MNVQARYRDSGGSAPGFELELEPMLVLDSDSESRQLESVFDRDRDCLSGLRASECQPVLAGVGEATPIALDSSLLFIG